MIDITLSFCVPCDWQPCCIASRYRHAQPISLYGVIGNSVALLLPTFGMAQGRRVPIFKGSPPILSE